VNESGAPPESIECTRCQATCSPDDNFCRQCGLSLRVAESLPAVRPKPLPVIRQAAVPVTVARGAALVAAAKLTEIVARSVVRRAVQRVTNSSRDSATTKPAIVDDNLEGDVFSETVILRHVRLRR
jgi:hypothetical protein